MLETIREFAVEKLVASGEMKAVQHHMATCVLSIGIIATFQGDARAACSVLEESHQVFHRIGDTREMAWSLTHLGYSIGVLNESERGFEMLKDSLDLHLGAGDADYEMALATLKSGLSPSELRACLDQGRETLPDEVIAEALSLVSQGAA